MNQVVSKFVRPSAVLGLLLSAACGDPSAASQDEDFNELASVSSGASATSAEASGTYTLCANEWGTCSFTGTAVVRFGDPGFYVYGTFTNGVRCRNDVFGSDPHVGSLTKTCSIQSTSSSASTATSSTTTPPSVKTGTTTGSSTTASDSYTTCANEWGTCSFSGTQRVRYGDPGYYVYGTFTNGVRCRNDVLGSDPHPGSLTKTCAIQSAATSAPVTSAPVTSAPVTSAPVTTVPVTTTPSPTSGSVQRPSYNKGTGFFVLNSKLYDANGNEFKIRGVNKVHWDNPSVGLDNAHANATRWTIDFNQTTAKNLSVLQGTGTNNGGTIAQKNVVIPGNWNGTCKEDPSYLTGMVDTWVAQASAFKTLEKYMILNIANEWGPNDSTVWRDQYITAIQRLRAAGYHATIQVTAGGCGQDPKSITHYGQDVFNADPEKNVIFDQHVYGSYQDIAGGAPGQWSNMPDLEPHMKDLQATGLVVIIGEFGPGRSVGPSPTNITPERVMQLAEQYGMGWLAWAWDDNNLSGGLSDDTWFGMSVNGSYNSSSDLTKLGKSVVENPTYGLKAVAKTASIFQ